jgi:hypothetical protein
MALPHAAASVSGPAPRRHMPLPLSTSETRAPMLPTQPSPQGGTRPRKSPLARHLAALSAAWVAALVAAGTPLAAEAQSITSPYRFIEGRHEIGGYVAHVPGNRGTMQLGPGDGLMMGARYSLDVGGPFAIEFGGFLLPTDRQVRAPNESGTDFDEFGSVDALVGGVDGRVRFTLTGPRTWNGLAPHLLAGGGAVGNLSGRLEEELAFPSDVRFTFGPSFLGVLGAGTRYFLTDQLVVRVDAVAHFWKVGTPQSFLAVETDEDNPVVRQQWPAVGAYSLGLSWRF